MNKKMASMKQQLDQANSELQNLRSSNDNLVLVNERLNKAYNKLLKKSKKREDFKANDDPCATGGSSAQDFVVETEPKKEEKKEV